MPKTQNKITKTLTKVKMENIKIKTDSKYEFKAIM